jgi:ATP-binding cassette subfamily B protein RaxB
MTDFGLRLGRRRLPVFLQQERAECGLVCLAMVAAYFGRKTDLASLRQQCGQSGNGATFQGLLEIAGKLNMIARPVRLSMSELPQLRLPAVLHWRMNHFVVLRKIGGRRFVIHDPASGIRAVEFAEVDESFTGVALEFTRSPQFVPGDEQKRMGIAAYAGSFRNLYRYLGLIFSLLVASQILALVPSIATQIVIDEVVLGQDRAWLYRALGGLAIVMLTGALLEGLRGWVSLYAGMRLTADSTVRVIDHLFRLPVPFINRRHLGDLMSRLESLTPIRQALTEHGVNAIVQLIVLITTLLIMFLYSPWLTAVSVAGLFVSIVLIFSLLPRSRRLSEQVLIHQAAQNSSLLESLKGYETIQGLGLSDVRRAHWQHSFHEATNARISQGKLAIFRSAASSVIAAAEQVAFLAIGVAGILEQELTLGVLFAFIVLRGRFSGAAFALTDLLQRFYLLRVHTDRLADIVLALPLPESPAGSVTAELAGSIRAVNLSFRYDANTPLIENFQCNIAAGANIVITGPSGCGKTTLLRMLSGLLHLDAGVILVDDVERSLWNRQVLCDKCAIVMQNDSLFRGTIAENISAFAATPDLAQIRAAAIRAEIWADIQCLPMQAQTLIGDTGISLSGGQIQRLALARALYRQPRILFLDEATSHLDVATEKRVLQNIAALKITTISVAHRPDAIALASEIIVLRLQ